VPTCRLGEELADAAARAAAAGWDVCMVVNEQGILLGRLDRKAAGSEHLPARHAGG
jgi:hypothetical protein